MVSSVLLYAIFLFNRICFRDLFLQGFQWTGALENNPILNRFLGIFILMVLSFFIAALLVSHSIISHRILLFHMNLLCNENQRVHRFRGRSWISTNGPSLHENCVIKFMECMSTICFYACKYKGIKYFLYLLGLILIIAYCFTGNLAAIAAVWLMMSLQKYCKFVVSKMFDPEKLYLDLTFTTYRLHKCKFLLNR